MLSLDDCIAFCGLTREQLDAVACHQHLPLIVVAEWAETVMDQEDGALVVEAILVEEVDAAPMHHPAHRDAWGRGLAEFRRTYPH
jgi:hypothetical protein